MPFGLKNALAKSSRMVAKLLLGLERFYASYLNDMIIFSDPWEEHLEHIKLHFDRVKNAGLMLTLWLPLSGNPAKNYL